MGNEKKEKEYAVGEVFRHADGKVYQCVEAENCKGCAFRCAGNDCVGPYCDGRSDGRSVKYIPVTKPADGMLFRAKDGKMYQLKYGEPSSFGCACNAGMCGCGCLNEEVSGDVYFPDWHWAPVESPKPVEPPRRHIELAVVKVEGDTVKFRIVEQTHRNGEFSRKTDTAEFKACNGISLMSYSVPQWLSSASALYCRGEDNKQDMCEITCTAGEFSRIYEAISEYNSTDGKGCEPRWPKKGDKYFYITVEGEVECFTFRDTHYEHKMRVFGNLFRTEAEAEAALERVRQALKK